MQKPDLELGRSAHSKPKGATPNNSSKLDGAPVAIVGAGLSGIVAARTLHQQGRDVTVFEKRRGTGGRMATRRHQGVAFDHGAQYFTARDSDFRHAVDTWRDQGFVEPWDGRIAVVNHGQTKLPGSTIERFVGVPKMSAVAGHLAAGLDIAYSTRIGEIRRIDGAWRLTSDEGTSLGNFGTVVLAIPPAQATPLLVDAPQLAEQCQGVTLLPCWAVMVVFDSSLEASFDGAFVEDSPLSWIASNSSKPGRPNAACWVLHGTPEWSTQHLSTPADLIADRLIKAFFEATALKPQTPRIVRAHRWLYSIARTPLEKGCLWDPGLRIGASGDWCQGSRVEGAFLSGREIANQILGLEPQRVESTARDHEQDRS